MAVSSGELLFVKSVKDGIPNRDPLNDSDARRLFGEEDGRVSLSDVSIKRDVRDYVLARYPDGGPDRRNFIYVREERTPDGKLLGRRELGQSLLRLAGREGEEARTALLASAFDVRVFGVVYSVQDNSFHLTGPVQFGWAHSLHPVETRYVQGTVVMPSEEGTSTQGTIWTTYIVPFAVFAMPAIINASLAQKTGMDEADQDLLLEALWRGTQQRQARGRGIQQPLFLLHVEYNDPYFRIGYLEDRLRLRPEREQWLSGVRPSSVAEVELDVGDLGRVLQEHSDRVERVRYWADPQLRLVDSEALREIAGGPQPVW